MRISTRWVCVALLAAGCAGPKAQPRPPRLPDAKNPPAPTITPDLRPVGRVELVNNEARFVVLAFPGENVPKPGRLLRVEHRGLNIGEVKVTGPERDHDTVADLLNGEANVGDEVKPE